MHDQSATHKFKTHVVCRELDLINQICGGFLHACPLDVEPGFVGLL